MRLFPTAAVSMHIYVWPFETSNFDVSNGHTYIIYMGTAAVVKSLIWYLTISTTPKK